MSYLTTPERIGQPCCERCVERDIWTATLLSSVRQAMTMWKSGFSFDGDAARVQELVTETLLGRKS